MVIRVTSGAASPAQRTRIPSGIGTHTNPQTPPTQAAMSNLRPAIALTLSLLSVNANENPSGWTTCGGMPPAYNRTACDANATCCTQHWAPGEGNWGCCPGKNSVCCKNGYTCCPEGTTCKDSGSGWKTRTECVSPSNADPVVGQQVCKQGPPMPLSTTQPNIIVIGDSVSIGYTPYVATAMKNDAYVQHSPWGGDGGAEESKYGFECIEYLLSAPDGTLLEPDVIMFNWGLHNSLSGNITADKDIPGQTGPPREYAPYLEKIVARLQQYGAKTKLLFAITSPDLCHADIDAIQSELNSQAVAIMAKANIPTVDLHSAITGKCGPVPTAECFGQKGCFCPHCNGNGYEWLANSTIVPALKKLL